MTRAFHWLGVLCLVLISNSAIADNVCDQSSSATQYKFFDLKNRISFRNEGGLFDGGVCWWHSRFQRAAIYLARYAPEKQKPSPAQAQKIVHDLTSMNHVVEIPGFENLFDFSLAFEPQIQKELDDWQLRDGFIFQQWARGLYGRSSLPPNEMKKRMSIIYSKFKKSLPGMWVMAQLPGITSHALLIIDMKPNADGFDLSFIDSNAPNTTLATSYHSGDRTVTAHGMVPYVGFNEDFVKIEKALKSSCHH